MITVILTEDVAGCGRAGDVCDVADGFARNKLLREDLAVVATPTQIEKLRAAQAKRAAERAAQEERAERITRLLDGKTITLTAKHDGDTLFAAIDAATIAQELGTLIDETVPAESIVIAEPIKTLGEHAVTLRFGESATATVRVQVNGA